PARELRDRPGRQGPPGHRYHRDLIRSPVPAGDMRRHRARLVTRGGPDACPQVGRSAPQSDDGAAPAKRPSRKSSAPGRPFPAAGRRSGLGTRSVRTGTPASQYLRRVVEIASRGISTSVGECHSYTGAFGTVGTFSTLFSISTSCTVGLSSRARP